MKSDTWSLPSPNLNVRRDVQIFKTWTAISAQSGKWCLKPSLSDSLTCHTGPIHILNQVLFLNLLTRSACSRLKTRIWKLRKLRLASRQHIFISERKTYANHFSLTKGGGISLIACTGPFLPGTALSWTPSTRSFVSNMTRYAISRKLLAKILSALEYLSSNTFCYPLQSRDMVRGTVLSGGAIRLKTESYRLASLFRSVSLSCLPSKQ